MEEEKRCSSGDELFQAALRCEPRERLAFVRSASGGNEDLRIAAESLLLAHEISHTAADKRTPPRFREATTDDTQTPRSIGGYRLIEKIGQGGMGQVWLAEQTEPIQRQVAVKLIRAGAYDDALLHRFESERRSLAMMDHPAIAKVFEAGAAATASRTW